MKPLLDETQRLCGQSKAEREANLTSYRVIADHVRAATFLLADGVIPGNIGRGYVCRMIIRRAARFARKIGLNEPFMAKIADIVIENYHEAYPEVLANKELIEETFTAEEKRFAETLDSGFEQLQGYIDELKAGQQSKLDGKRAFDLYATLGFPVEITRDILAESGLEVDEKGFYEAMEAHRLASGKGSAFADMNNLDTELYQNEFARLVESGTLPASGVEQNPYGRFSLPAKLVSLIADGESIGKANPGQEVSLILNQTPFYLESGGQVSDTGFIRAADGSWEVEITALSRRLPGSSPIMEKCSQATHSQISPCSRSWTKARAVPRCATHCHAPASCGTAQSAGRQGASGCSYVDRNAYGLTSTIPMPLPRGIFSRSKLW